MKGLFLKDFYMIRSVLFIMFIVFLVIGAGLSFLSSPWVLIVLATVMLGMNAATTINMDRTSGWLKISNTLPIDKKTLISSKYMLYLTLSAMGLIFGVLLSVIVSRITGDFDPGKILLFISISITMSLMAGSLMIPCYFLFSEDKSILGTILAYPVSAGIFVTFALLIDDQAVMAAVNVCIAVIMFTISWKISTIYIVKKDV